MRLGAIVRFGSAGLIRTAGMALLLGACLASGGCLQTLVGALLAPEAMAVEGVSGGVQQLGNALLGNSATDAQNVASDLDRILGEDDAAKERPELQALHDKLAADADARKNPHREGSAADEAERRAERDRRVELPPEKRSLTSDQIALGQISGKRARRPDGKPWPQPEATPLDPWSPQMHVMDLTPVRIR